MASPKINVLIPQTCECYLYGKRHFANVIKYLEMVRLSWIIEVDPKCNYKCPYKREMEGDLTTEELALSSGKQRLG